ncbi:hypothetical protein WH91_13580 [Devosia psychrophila]|uniref:Uncharacterized protein n=1 Tax=Devosia psychrophila TaxID=728005 RepID=A0ABR5DWY6_9HYPH|nr:hypothetical protein WH91_13580 [Devosia psychrophila]
MAAHWLIVDADRAEPKVLRAERARTILDMVSIRVRLAEADDRAIPGHWEGGLLAGAKDTNIATLVTRASE